MRPWLDILFLKEDDCHMPVSIKIKETLDTLIRFFLYLLVFWLPYSKAVVEVCVVAALLLWIVKRVVVALSVLPDRFRWRVIAGAFRPAGSPLNRPIFAFLLVCLLSVVGGAFWEQSWHGFLTKTLEWFIVYFLVIEVFRERRHFRVLFLVFLITSVATAIDGLVQYYLTHKDIFLGRELVDGQRATAGFTHSNALGGYLTLALPVVLAGLFAPYRRKWLKRVMPFVWIIMTWSLAVTFSRWAWLSAVAAMLYCLYLTKRRLFKKVILILAIILIVAGGMILSSPPKQAWARMDKTNVSNIPWRWGIWVDTLTMIQQRPFLGHGLNTYMLLFQRYRQLSPRLQGREWAPTYAHNCYLQLTAETGLVGLTAFLWIVIRFFRTMAEGRRINEREGQVVVTMLAGVASGVLGLLLHSFADTDFYSLQLSVLLWVWVGVAIALEQMLSLSKNCDIKII